MQVEVVHCSGTKPRHLADLRATVEVLSTYSRYDVILSEQLSTIIFPIIPLLLVHRFLRRKTPKLVALDIPISVRGKSIVVEHLIKSLTPVISQIICFTSTQKDWWRRFMHFSRVEFVPLGIDPTFNFSDDCEICCDIFAGGNEGRDYETLVTAAHNLKKNVTIVSSYRLPRRISDDPLVRSLNWFVPFDVFIRLMSESRVVAVILKESTFAAAQTVLLEAMAMGKPIVVTKTASTQDYIEDGKTGLFVNPGDVQDLEDKLRRLLSDSSLMQSLGSNARQTVRERFSATRTEEQIVSIIRSSFASPPESLQHGRRRYCRL